MINTFILTSKPIARVAVELALFSNAPEFGDVNPPGEIVYKGYHRTWAWFINGINEETIVFPEFTQEEPVYVVAFDLKQKVVGVKKIEDYK